MSEQFSTISPLSVQRSTGLTLTVDRPDPFAKLPDLARRLGVEPRQAGSPPGLVISTQAGLSYDLFDLLNAALDRLEPRP